MVTPLIKHKIVKKRTKYFSPSAVVVCTTRARARARARTQSTTSRCTVTLIARARFARAARAIDAPSARARRCIDGHRVVHSFRALASFAPHLYSARV